MVRSLYGTRGIRKPSIGLIGFSVFHFNTPLYHPPANTEMGDIPAAKVVGPASLMAPAYEEVYFLKDENLYCVQTIAVDESVNRQLYDQVRSSFRFEA